MNKKNKNQSSPMGKNPLKTSKKITLEAFQNLEQPYVQKKIKIPKSLKSKQVFLLEESKQSSTASLAKARELLEQMSIRARSKNKNKLKGRITVTTIYL
jgi:hypothetical protein